MNGIRKYKLDDTAFVWTIANWVTSTAQIRTLIRKAVEKDLISHGGRRHALYFCVDDTLRKQEYEYGGKKWPMARGHPLQISDMIDRLKTEFGISFNGSVVNVYSKIKSWIWWHTDQQVGVGQCVGTVSFGRTGTLEFRKMKSEQEKGDKSENPIELAIDCEDGMLLVMGPGVNERYQHRVHFPTEEQIEEAKAKFGKFGWERMNITLHWHSDPNVEKHAMNIEPSSSLWTLAEGESKEPTPDLNSRHPNSFKRSSQPKVLKLESKS